MAGELVDTFLEVVSGLFEGIGDGIIELFATLIYDTEDGLTILAEWMLVFMAFSFAITIFYALWRKVAQPNNGLPSMGSLLLLSS